MKTRTQRNRNQPRVRASYDKKSGLVRLNVPLTVKAEAVDTSARTFEGLAATWDEDLGSDIIHKGAFKKSIAEWKSATEAMPLLNSHDQFDIFSALGQAIAMKETDEGLWTKWEVLEGPDGDKVLARLRPSVTTKRAIISKMSIGFIPTKFEFEQPEGSDSFWDRIRHINEANLKEVSLVLFPMNPNASIDASTVKMWLKMAHDQDPRKLDRFARLELRRLNSKIGLLLKKQKPEDDEELDEEENDSQSPPIRKKTSARTPERKVDAEDDDTDDLDDEDLDEDDVDNEDDIDDESDDDSDDTDDTDEDDEDDTDEETDEEDDDKKKSSKKPVDKKVKKDDKKVGKKKKVKAPTDKKEDDEPKPYAFSEALAQRIQKVTLTAKTSELKERIRT